MYTCKRKYWLTRIRECLEWISRINSRWVHRTICTSFKSRSKTMGTRRRCSVPTLNSILRLWTFNSSPVFFPGRKAVCMSEMPVRHPIIPTNRIMQTIPMWFNNWMKKRIMQGTIQSTLWLAKTTMVQEFSWNCINRNNNNKMDMQGLVHTITRLRMIVKSKGIGNRREAILSWLEITIQI